MPFENRAVISVDGSRTVFLRTAEGPRRDVGRQAQAIAFNTVLPNEVRGPRIVVYLTDNAIQFSDLSKMRFQRSADEALDLSLLAEAAIGEWLDTNEVKPAGAESPTIILCTSDQMTAWRDRSRADDARIIEYAGWKAYWGWRFELKHCELGNPECLRLGARLQTLINLLTVEAGEAWSMGETTASYVRYQPSARFIKGQRDRHLRIGSTGIGDHISESLRAPRYDGVRRHFEKAERFMTSATPDYANVAKEAVSAVEALCRLVCNRPNDTLGELLKHLRRAQQIDPAMVKSIEGLWGYTSNEPGVRHGGTATIDAAQAALTLALARSTVAYLLRADTGGTTPTA